MYIIIIIIVIIIIIIIIIIIKIIVIISWQRPLSSGPKVAVVERFDCNLRRTASIERPTSNKRPLAGTPRVTA